MYCSSLNIVFTFDIQVWSRHLSFTFQGKDPDAPKIIGPPVSVKVDDVAVTMPDERFPLIKRDKPVSIDLVR